MKRKSDDLFTSPSFKKSRKKPLYSTTKLSFIKTRETKSKGRVKYFFKKEMEGEEPILQVYQQDHLIGSKTKIKYKLPKDTIYSALHPTGTKLAILTKNGNLYCMDALKNYENQLLDDRKYPIKSDIKWSVNGNYLWVAGNAKFSIFENGKYVAEFCDQVNGNDIDPITYIVAVHPTNENEAIVNCSMNHFILKYDNISKTIHFTINVDLDDVTFFTFDPFCLNWNNFCDFTSDTSFVIYKNGKSLCIDGNKIKYADLEAKRSTDFISIQNFTFLNSNKMFFTCENEEDVDCYYAALLDWTDEDDPSIYSWPISLTEYDKNYNWYMVLAYPRPMKVTPRLENNVHFFQKEDYLKIPDDCWYHIFTFLEIIDLLHVSHSCKWMNDLTYQTWKDISLQKWKLHSIEVSDWKEYCLLRTFLESQCVTSSGVDGNLYCLYPTKIECILKKFLQKYK